MLFLDTKIKAESIKCFYYNKRTDHCSEYENYYYSKTTMFWSTIVFSSGCLKVSFALKCSRVSTLEKQIGGVYFT